MLRTPVGLALAGIVLGGIVAAVVMALKAAAQCCDCIGRS